MWKMGFLWWWIRIQASKMWVRCRGEEMKASSPSQLHCWLKPAAFTKLYGCKKKTKRNIYRQFFQQKHVNKQLRKRVLHQQEIHRQFLNNLRLLTSERATPSQAAELMCQEMGKPVAQGKAEVLKCAYLVSRWCLVYILYLLRYKKIYNDKCVGDRNSVWSQGFQEQLTYVIVIYCNESNSDFQPIE